MTTTENKDDTGRQAPPAGDGDNLDVNDPILEDEDKDDAEIWDDIEQEEIDAENDLLSDDTDDDALAAKDSDNTDSDDSAGQPGDRQSSGAASAGDQDDPFANATPEQKAAWDAAQARIAKLDQSDRSNRGRLSAMQQKVNSLMNAQPAPGQEPGDEGAAAGSYLESEEFKAFADEYPEVAGPMRAVVSGLETKINQHDSQLFAADQGRYDEFVEEQTDLLEKEVPDWEEQTAAEGFGPWLESQPRHIKEAAVRNANEIVDAAEAADVVSRFKAFRSEGAGASNDNASSRRGGGGNQSRLSGKRQRQLDSAAGSQRGGPGAASGIPEDGDEEALWKQFDKLEARQQARRA